jgi:hypothetical protein
MTKTVPAIELVFVSMTRMATEPMAISVVRPMEGPMTEMVTGRNYVGMALESVVVARVVRVSEIYARGLVVAVAYMQAYGKTAPGKCRRCRNQKGNEYAGTQKPGVNPYSSRTSTFFGGHSIY